MAGQVAHYRGPGGVVWPMALPLDPVMAKQARKGIIRQCNPDGSPYREQEPEPTPAAEPDAGQGEQGGQQEPEPTPAQSAQKADWVGYAVRVGGLTVDDAEAMTKVDLVERFGGRAGD